MTKENEELPKTIVIGIGQPEMEAIQEDGFFEYILVDHRRLRLVLEDEDGKMDERGLRDID